MEERKPGGAGAVGVALAVLNGIGVIGSVVLSLVIRGKFSAIFAELGAALPGMTRLFLSLHPATLVLAAVILLGILTAASLIPGKVVPHVLNGVVLIVGVVYWAVFLLAIFLPLLAVLHSMGGAG